MAKAKVLVTDIGGKGKRIFHHGDVVTEESFPEGKFQKLVDGKFIQVIAETEAEKPTVVEDSNNELPETNTEENERESNTEESGEENESSFGFNKSKKKKGKK